MGAAYGGGMTQSNKGRGLRGNQEVKDKGGGGVSVCSRSMWNSMERFS